MVKNVVCPKCNIEAEDGVCKRCGLEIRGNDLKKQDPPRNATYSKKNNSNSFWRWWFWNLKKTGKYDPNYVKKGTVVKPDSSGGAIKIGAVAAKTSISMVNPPLGTIISGAEVVYKGYQEISGAISDAQRIWNSDSDSNTKLYDIACRFGQAGLETTKTAAPKIISSLTCTMSEHIVQTMDDFGIFDSIEEKTGIAGLGDTARNLLVDIAKDEISKNIGAAS